MEERLQKLLAAAGVASRREAEKLIVAGRVQVNGKVITELGYKCGPQSSIKVDGKLIAREKKVYYLFNKPKGVVTTMEDPEGRACIAEYVQELKQRVYPVGRLDYNTEGLLLLTNDGALAQALTHPSHQVGKTYTARVKGLMQDDDLDKLRMGVRLEDGLTAPARTELLERDKERGLTTFNLTIYEGRNRQVRRMCEAIGFPVRDLKRIKLGPLNLKGTARGKLRPLSEGEVDALYQAAGL